MTGARNLPRGQSTNSARYHLEVPRRTLRRPRRCSTFGCGCTQTSLPAHTARRLGVFPRRLGCTRRTRRRTTSPDRRRHRRMERGSQARSHRTHRRPSSNPPTRPLSTHRRIHRPRDSRATPLSDPGRRASRDSLLHALLGGLTRAVATICIALAAARNPARAGPAVPLVAEAAAHRP